MDWDLKLYTYVLAITETDDVETIKKCVSNISDILCVKFDITHDEAVEHIREGEGMFNDINDKCIELNLV